MDWLRNRTMDITSTEVAALFDLSPYMTKFELWHKKKDQVILEIEANERMAWGDRLESVIATGIGEDKGWAVSPFKNYMRIPDIRLGSSFDYIINDQDAILEIKNVDGLIFKNQWLKDDDSFEAPDHIELQVQVQLLVSGKNKAHIGVFVGGNKIHLIEREPDLDIQAAIIEKTKEFWQSIYDNNPPSPDFNKDFDFIKSMYDYAEPGKLLKSDEFFELAKQYKDFATAAKEAEEAKQAIKAEILTKIGDHEKVQGAGYSISSTMIGPTSYTVNKEGYRDFRIFLKKPKEEKQPKQQEQ